MASNEPPFLEALAIAVADGSDVDWDQTASSAASAHERQVVEQLRRLAEVGKAARQLSSSWGPFEIRAEIGRGSFGTVYRAWYPKLECEVALKILRDSDASRIREACLLAQIRHPNVVTVFGADTIDGRDGIWMEFVTGQTLKAILEKQGPFGADEAALIGRDVCRALAAVHLAGFVHGDIKAQNVMRGAGGRTVLMDFGAGHAAIDGDHSPADRLVGSPVYVAPEVLAGGRPTVQSDLYSLGVLLYHLATGTFPVTAATLDELRTAHAHGQRRLLRDARPDLPHAFVHAVDRATALAPAERPDSAGKLERLLEIALGVRSIDDSASGPLPEIAVPRPSPPPHARTAWWKTMAIATILAAVVGVAGWLALTAPVAVGGGTRVAAVHAITVAPLDVKNGDASWSTIARTMAADVARHLDGPGLLVKGRSLPIGRGDADVAAQAHDLGADAVVTGTLTVSDRDLALDVTVLDTATERPMFQKRYATTRTEAESLPLRVSSDITSALGFGSAASATTRPQVSLEAYDHYARGRQLAEQREPTALVRATQQFEEAIRIESQYAPAWAELADAYIALGVPAFGPLRPFEARGKAREAALKALDLDPNLAEAHTALAFLSFFYDWNWDAADERFQRALRLNPNDSQAHHWYADYLNAMGRFSEATEHIHAACDLEPLSILFQRDVGWHLFFQRHYPEAIAQLQHTLAQEPTYMPAISLLGRAFVQNGDTAAGIATLQRLDLTNPANQAMLAYAYAAAGDRAQVTAWLAKINAAAAMQYVSPYSVALVYAALGDKERAFERLTAAFDEQDSTIVNVSVDPRFDGLRSDARFAQLLARLRFPSTAERPAR